jgi:uncharacterized protein YndB with AHSA1/START domain
MRAVKRIGVWLSAVLVALGAGVAGGGAFLPRAHEVTGEVVIARPLDVVWPVVRDLGSVSRWWPEVETSARAGDGQGPERWDHVIEGVKVTVEIVDDQPPRRLVTRIVAPEDAGVGGMWTYDLSPEKTATRVRLTEEGWVGPWPLRTITWLSGYRASIDSYLKSLARYFGQEAVVVDPGVSYDVPSPMPLIPSGTAPETSRVP